MPATFYDSADAVPEANRANAIETKDGRFAVLDEPDVSGLKSKNSELLSKLTAANKRAALFGDRSEEDIQADFELAAKTREDKAKAEGDFNALKEQLIKTHSTELEKATGRTKKVEGKLYDVLAKNEAVAAIIAAGGDPKILLPHVLPALKVEEVDEDFVARVVDAKGKPRIADGQATPMTIAQLVDEFKADESFGVAFKPRDANGTGSRNSDGSPRNSGAVVISKEDAKDVQKYRAAKERAEKAGVPFSVAS